MLKKRIPTLIGLILLVGGALAGVLFVNQGTGFLPRAAPEYIPQKVKVTNVTDTSFTISWVTQEPAIGFIKYGVAPGKLDTTVVDERDQLTGDSQEYRTHYVSVLGVSPSTTYYLKLGSHGKQLYDNDGHPLSVSTGPTLQSAPPAHTAYGIVNTPADTPAEGAMIYLTATDADLAPLSALVKQNGNWAISLSLGRTQNLATYASVDPQSTQLNLLVRSTISDDATALVATGNDQPVPPITLGQTHNFINQTTSDNQPIETPAVPPPESRFSLVPLEVTEPETDTSLAIQTPAKDNQIVVGSTPALKGKAPPGTALTITLQSAPIYTDTVYTDETGVWQYVPPGTLTPGNHTLTISYTDADGLFHTQSRSFVVASATADADLPQYSATPSATLTPLPSTTPAPGQTPVPTNQPTVTPAPTEQPQITPTVKPTNQPSPTPTQELMDAGTVVPSAFMLILGFGLFFFGIYTALERYPRRQ